MKKQDAPSPGMPRKKRLPKKTPVRRRPRGEPRDAEAQSLFWTRLPPRTPRSRIPDETALASAGFSAPDDGMPPTERVEGDSVCRGVLAVHGIGGGTGAERAGFSQPLRDRVLSAEVASTHWHECVWEDLNDEWDARIGSVVREMAKGPALTGFLAGSRRLKAILRMFEGAGGTRRILRMLDGLTRDAATWFVCRTLDFGLDFWRYLDSAHGARIRKRLRACIATAAKAHPEGLVLVAHSLGSVVAYDVLSEASRKGSHLPVSALVTCGSPLAWTFSLREADGKPECRNRSVGGIPWTNVYYREDCVSLYKPLSADRFREARNVALPLPAGATARTAHAAYWRDPAVARIVREAIRGDHE